MSDRLSDDELSVLGLSAADFGRDKKSVFVAGLVLALLCGGDVVYGSAMYKTPAEPFIIYALHHDSSDYIYVGKSTKGLQRAVDHGRPSNLKTNARLPVVKWIKKRREEGNEYAVSVLERCSAPEDLVEAERFYISYFRSIGVQLLNCSDGGEGLFNPTPETRARLCSAQKKLQNTPERREKGRIANTGKKRSAATRALISIAHERRLPVSTETRERHAKATTGERGQRQKTTKLSRDQVIAIRHLYSAGIKVSVLQKHFRIGNVQIYRIINKQRWAWLPDVLTASAEKLVRQAPCVRKNAGVRWDVMKAWRLELRMNQTAAALLLGIGKRTLFVYEKTLNDRRTLNSTGLEWRTKISATKRKIGNPHNARWDVLVAWRVTLGLTQEKAAVLLGMGATTLRRHEYDEGANA